MRRWLARAALLSIALCTSSIVAQESVYPILTLATDQSATKARWPSIARVQFNAYGRDFDLNLRSNDRLKAGLAPTTQARLGTIRLYRGKLDSYADSWVRLADHDGGISGVIWDGAGLYILQQKAEQYTIHRDNESLTTAGSLIGDIIRPETDRAAAGDQEIAVIPLALPVGSGKTIEIGVVADSTYAAQRGNQAEAGLLQTMNIVDGIFTWQLGVRISLAEIQILDVSDDPFFDASGAVFLDELSDMKGASPTLASLGLVHLFTGRNILGSNPEPNPVGVANIGGACDEVVGIGITTGRSITGDARVAAHEISHNFGAPHDNEIGSACAATPAGFLMERMDNGSSVFSQCSINQMLPIVATRPCFIDWQPNDLAVRIVDGTSEINLLTEPGFLSVAIDNADIGTGNAVELIVETTESIDLSALREPNGESRIGFDCEHTSHFGRCTASYLAAGSSANFELDLFAQSMDGGEVTVTVNSGNDPNSVNDSLVFPITVPSAVDIAATVQLLPGQARAGDFVFYPGDLVELSATVENLSGEVATNAIATFDFLPSSTEYVVAAPVGIDCTIEVFGTRFDCHLGELQGGEQRVFDLSFRTLASVGETTSLASDTVRIEAKADQHDPYLENNQATAWAYSSNGIFDLVLGATYPDVIEVGTPATFEVWLENRGPDAARFVSLDISQVYSPIGFEFLSVNSNLADCSRALLQALLSCDVVDTLHSGEKLTITYEFVANGPLDFFATPKFAYVGYELGMNAEPPLINFRVGEQDSDPQPQPAPAPTPTTSSSSGGGGGAAGVPTLLALLIACLFAGASQRKQRYQHGVVCARAVLDCEIRNSPP